MESDSLECGLSIPFFCLDKDKINKACEIAHFMQRERSEKGHIPVKWVSILSKKSLYQRHYAPRWTFPLLYFRGLATEVLQNAVGLDVGARIRRFTGTGFCPKLSVPPDKDPNDLLECYVPHYFYYNAIGCTMKAIDLLGDHEQNIIEGDIRCLDFESCSFDFLTIATILGQKHCCSSPIEIALSISEIWRVLRPGGFAYLADTEVDPFVVYSAQKIGFIIYVSKGTPKDMPIGVLLYRPASNTNCSKVSTIFNAFKLSALGCNLREDEILRNADLLWDKSAPFFEAAPKAITV